MVGVGGGTVTENLCDWLRAAVQSMLQFLDHKNSGSFAHDKTGAVTIKRAGRARRHIIEARRKGARRGKASEADEVDACFRASANRNVRFPGPDQTRRIADRLDARRAGGDR